MKVGAFATLNLSKCYTLFISVYECHDIKWLVNIVNYFNWVDVFSPVVDCGNPTDLANVKVTFEETTFRHIANYTCRRGHWFNRGQRQIATKCEDNGNWTHVEDTCKGLCLYS